MSEENFLEEVEDPDFGEWDLDEYCYDCDRLIERCICDYLYEEVEPE